MLSTFVCLDFVLTFQGRRSVSDDLYETVNYIRDLQDKIQELNDKRDGQQYSEQQCRPTFSNKLLEILACDGDAMPDGSAGSGHCRLHTKDTTFRDSQFSKQ